MIHMNQRKNYPFEEIAHHINIPAHFDEIDPLAVEKAKTLSGPKQKKQMKMYRISLRE